MISMCILLSAKCAVAQTYMSDTYGYACYNYFDNTTLSKTVSGTTTTSSTANVYAPTFLPDPDVSGNNTSVVVSSASVNNLSNNVTSSRCLQSKYQATPKSVYVNNIPSSADAAYLPLNSNDWEWNMLYKSNLSSGTYPVTQLPYTTIAANTNAWRYWLHASSSTITATTQGFFITQSADGYLHVYVTDGNTSNPVHQLLVSNSALTNGQTYAIKIQRLIGGYWKLYVDQYSTSVTQATTLQTTTTSSDYYTDLTLTYTNCVLEAENASGSDGAFQFDELHMYTRYLSFTGIASPANGVTPSPLYAGEGTVILYGYQLQTRGNFELGGQIYMGKNDGSGYFEGNFSSTNGTLYKTTSNYFSVANATSLGTVSLNGGGIGGTSSVSTASLNDFLTSQGNYDGTLSTPAYYFITAVVASSLQAYQYGSGYSTSFTGNVQVYDYAKNNTPISDVSSAGSTTSNVTFGNVFDWLGATSTAWNTLSNWKENGTTPAAAYPQASSDYVRIGYVNYTGSNQPQLNVGPITVGTLEFGPYGSTSSSTPASSTLDLDGHALTASTGVRFDASASAFIKNSTGTASTFTAQGNSTMASTSSLNFSTGTGNLTFSNAGTYTLMSDVNGSAGIGTIQTGVTVSGTYIVQRYISGGNANSRGYRLISSPVYAGTTGGNNVISINYIQNYAILSGTSGSTNGFDLAGNPTIYLYRDDKAFTNSSFTGGNFWGISALNNSPAYNYTVAGGGTSGNFYIPVGNGVMFFYRGDRFDNKFNKTNANYATAESQVFATSGTLNTGQITVKDWFTSTLSTLDCTAVSGNSAVVGFNLVGNPYPCNINWDTYNTTTSTTGIYAPNVSNKYYIYNPKNKNYATYIANSSGIGSYDPSTANIIPSGQGFFVKAANSSAQLIFNESAKTTSQVNTSYLLLNSLPSSASVPYFHLKLIQDTLNDDATLFMFKPTASTGYVESEDAEVFAGSGSVTLSSVSSDNKALAINTLPLPGLKQTTIPLKVYTAGSGLYTLNRMDIHNIPQLFDVWLMDAYKKDSLDIKHNTTYNFNVNKADTNSAGSKRFSVVIRQNPAYAYKLLGFSGVKVLQGAQLKWVTENEADYTSFSLERSNDNGVTYNAITSVQGNASATYTYLDTRPVTGVNLYRLKQTDINGTISYSKVVSLSYADLSNNIANNLNVYPNPASGMLNLSVAQQVQTDAASYEIKIINTSGLLVKEAVSQQPYWQGSVANLSPGTYVIEVINKTTQTPVGKTKFVKL